MAGKKMEGEFHLRVLSSSLHFLPFIRAFGSVDSAPVDAVSAAIDNLGAPA